MTKANMSNKYLQRMIKLALAGGKLSLAMMQNSKPSLKPDKSVLTLADTAVSKLIREGLADFLKDKDNILIDEEDKHSNDHFDQRKLEKISYIFVADPIDGTRNFANRLPLYGVSLGLLKDLKPWLSVIYAPALDEMFYSDGKRSYYVRYASTQKPKKALIKPVDQKITRQSVYFGSDGFFKTFEWDFSLCQIMLPSCAVLDLCWPAVGKGVGSFFNANLWDFAGAWPIIKAAGLDLRHLKTGKILDRVNTELYIGEGDRTWKLKDFYIMSSARNFPIIRKAITPKR